MPKILSEIEAILKVSGVAAFLPVEIKDKVCHSVAIDIVNYYEPLIEQAKAEVVETYLEKMHKQDFIWQQQIEQAKSEVKEQLIIALTERIRIDDQGQAIILVGDLDANGLQFHTWWSALTGRTQYIESKYGGQK